MEKRKKETLDFIYWGFSFLNSLNVKSNKSSRHQLYFGRFIVEKNKYSCSE